MRIFLYYFTFSLHCQSAQKLALHLFSILITHYLLITSPRIVWYCFLFSSIIIVTFFFNLKVFPFNWNGVGSHCYVVQHYERREQQRTPIFLPDKYHGEGAWWAAVHEITKSWTQLSNWACKAYVLACVYVCACVLFQILSPCRLL